MRTALITGASSGIGAATARALSADGWRVIVAARRLDRLAQVAAECAGPSEVCALDVTDPDSVAACAEQISTCDLLVNNAGGAKGTDSVAEADEADWQWMYDTNVLGTLRMTKAMLPKLIASGDGLIVTVGSLAAHEPYPGGAGYNAAKFAESALMRVLRQELLGQPVRISQVDPGKVKTDFSLVRFKGDQAKADAVYEGMTSLTADDVAECIRWIAAQPAHVNIDSLRVLPRDQAGSQAYYRH